jgi:hypothetical protein
LHSGREKDLRTKTENGSGSKVKGIEGKGEREKKKRT